MRMLLSIVTACLALSLTDVAHGSPMSIHEKRDAVPAGYVSKGLAPAHQVLNLRLALAPRNITGLEAVLYAVSTPGSAQYKQYLTQDQVTSVYLPSLVSGVSNDLTHAGRSIRKADAGDAHFGQ